MRIDRLELRRYGKFTDTALEFPRADVDFHLIIGPNEAGKSTLRTAISELFYGMPTRSTMGFMHEQSTLRLCARITGSAGALAFQRVKANKYPLLAPDDTPLKADALAPYLGGTDKAFFDQMFGLTHEQLVAGGQSILNASGNVGQMLFEAASGIASLGAVRDRLEAEANTLWAPRRSADRAYYQAADALSRADQELKAATVRSKAWAEARHALDEARDGVAAIERALSEQDAERTRLERVRRLAPRVQALRAGLAELQAMGEVDELPADAARQLSASESAISMAADRLSRSEAALRHAQDTRDSIHFDAGLLPHQEAIESLAQMRHRIANHARDIGLRQSEVDGHLTSAREGAEQLGWPTDAAAIRDRLPSSITLKQIEKLLQDRGVVFNAQRAAGRALASKQREHDALLSRHDAVADLAVDPALRAALVQARALRDTHSVQAALRLEVEAAQASADQAMQALGAGWRALDALRALALPSPERAAGLRAEHDRLQADARAAAQRLQEARAAEDEAGLALDQFAAGAAAVTAEDVRAARRQRDATWAGIKDGTRPLPAAAPLLDSEMALADQLADGQLASAQAAAELQSLRQQHERARAGALRAGKAHADHVAALAAFDARWQALTGDLGLPELLPDELPAWLGRRDAALAAGAALAQSRRALEQEQDRAARALHSLAALLQQAAHAGENAGEQAGEISSLPLAIQLAEDRIGQANTAQTRRETLAQQIREADVALKSLQADLAQADEDVARWQDQWAQALEKARISAAGQSPAEVEASVGLLTRIADHLEKAASLQRERIDPMHRDLDAFAEQAQALSTRMGLGPLTQAPEVFAQDISEQARAAATRQALWTAADEALRAAQAQHRAAREELEGEQARIAPLLALAGVPDMAQARPVVARSDRHRELRHAVSQAEADILAQADGLSLSEALAEVDAADLEEITARLSTLSASVKTLQAQAGAATEARLTAQQAFDAIDGGDRAARAQARRLEALSDMSRAVERYVEVATASRLLRWAIERYRDRSQGPMLRQASAIFSGLTLGGFQKLEVDFEQHPPTLSAVRQDGARVGVAGLSEGTRDQLYLALRLAALELHIERTAPLPFVADDLFINFDDARTRAGLEALKTLARRAQVIFLTHHEHFLPMARETLGTGLNVVRLERSA